MSLACSRFPLPPKRRREGIYVEPGARFKKNTKATRVYKKFTHSWSQDIYESNKSSWTKEDDIDLLYIDRLLDKKSRTKKTIPHIKLKTKDQIMHTSNYDSYNDLDKEFAYLDGLSASLKIKEG